MKKLVYAIAIAFLAFSCEDDDTTTPAVELEAATLTSDSFQFCAGDGEEDRISDAVVVDAGIGENAQIIVTDDQGNVLGLPPVFEGPDFDTAGVGMCYVYHANFNGELSGLTGPDADGATTSNIDDIEGDYALSNFVVVNRIDCGVELVAATLTSDSYTFCVADGIPDNITDNVVVDAGSGSLSTFVATDANKNILGLPGMAGGPDFDGAGFGMCYLYHINYNPGIVGLTGPDENNNPTSNLDDLDGEFELSNFIMINREDCSPNVTAAVLEAGASAVDGEYTFAVDGMADNVTDLVVAEEGVGESMSVVITDSEGKILGLPPMASAVNFDDAGVGVCYIRYIFYDGEITGLAASTDTVSYNVADLEGSFKLSNIIVVNRN